MSEQRFEQVTAFDTSKRATSGNSTATMERSRYWIFDEQQLKEALADWLSNHGDQEQAGRRRIDVADFLHSDACAERGLRRGGEG